MGSYRRVVGRCCFGCCEKETAGGRQEENEAGDMEQFLVKTKEMHVSFFFFSEIKINTKKKKIKGVFFYLLWQKPDNILL